MTLVPGPCDASTHARRVETQLELWRETWMSPDVARTLVSAASRLVSTHLDGRTARLHEDEGIPLNSCRSGDRPRRKASRRVSCSQGETRQTRVSAPRRGPRHRFSNQVIFPLMLTVMASWVTALRAQTNSGKA